MGGKKNQRKQYKVFFGGGGSRIVCACLFPFFFYFQPVFALQIFRLFTTTPLSHRHISLWSHRRKSNILSGGAGRRSRGKKVLFAFLFLPPSCHHRYLISAPGGGEMAKKKKKKIYSKDESSEFPQSVPTAHLFKTTCSQVPACTSGMCEKGDQRLSAKRKKKKNGL